LFYRSRESKIAQKIIKSELHHHTNNTWLIDVKQALVFLSTAKYTSIECTDRFHYSEETETAQFNGTKQRRKQQETRSKS